MLGFNPSSSGAEQLRALVSVIYLTSGHPLPAALLPPVNVTAEAEKRDSADAIRDFYARCVTRAQPSSPLPV